MNGQILFESNNIDQSDGFLREVVLTLLSKHIEGFEIIDEAIDEVSYNQEYDFETDSLSDLEFVMRDPIGFDSLFEQTAEVKRYYPKEQFNQLKIKWAYVNQTNEDVVVEIVLSYDKDLHEIQTVILDASPY